MYRQTVKSKCIKRCCTLGAWIVAAVVATPTMLLLLFLMVTSLLYTTSLLQHTHTRNQFVSLINTEKSAFFISLFILCWSIWHRRRRRSGQIYGHSSKLASHCGSLFSFRSVIYPPPSFYALLLLVSKDWTWPTMYQ